MARIAGVNIPSEKRLVIGLTYIYGIGSKTSEEICLNAKISVDKRVKDLTDDEVLKIREYIEKHFKVEGERRSEVSQNIKRLMDLRTYRGLRHRHKLPSRGQRTRSNARTRKGKAIPIAGKKKAV